MTNEKLVLRYGGPIQHRHDAGPNAGNEHIGVDGYIPWDPTNGQLAETSDEEGNARHVQFLGVMHDVLERRCVTIFNVKKC